MDVAERPKRQKRDSSGKSKAFEKLRQLKSGGSKNKYEVAPMENVYEELSEQEYTDTVLKRQQDDWIVDDYGAEGYVEDGREIFDDDLDEESIQRDRKSKKRDHSGIPKNVEAPKGNIQKMLANMPAKKKKVVKLEEDDILGDLMSELNESFDSKNSKDSSTSNLNGNSTTPVRRDYSRSVVRPNVQMIRRRIPDIPKSAVKVEPKQEPREEVVTEDLDCDDWEPMNIPDDPVSIENKEVTKHAAPKIESKPEEFTDDLILSEWEPMGISNDSVPTRSISDAVPKPVEVKTESKIDPKIITEDQMCSGWETTTSSANESMPNVNIDCSQLPLIEKENGKKVFKFFYWDAYEDVFNKPGTIFLFGKVQVEGSFASCCITVRNVERRVFLLPREKKFNLIKKQSTDEPVRILDVYDEFNKKIAEKYRITKFKSMKVNKNYAFNIGDVPDSSDYLEVRYGAEFSALPQTLVGETFSHVFGTNTPFLEIFLVERRIKGPCWLELSEPLSANPLVSWCKFEAVCDDITQISVVNDGTPPPPLVVLTINMRITPIPPKAHENQVTMISCLVHHSYHTDKEAPNPPFQQHFCAFTKPNDVTWPYDHKEVLNNCKATKLDKIDTERALLGFFLAKYHKIDPDLIVGHDIYGFDIGTLVYRLTANKIMHWSRLGRLRRANVPNFGKSKNFAERNIMCGRLLCDIQLSAKELIKARSYDLDSLCQQVLNAPEGEIKNIKGEEIKAFYKTSQSLINLIKFTMQDAAFILRIMYKLNAIPLSLQITNIAGNVLSRTLMGGRSERNEYLLLHAFSDKNYIVPDKNFGGKKGKDAVELEDGVTEVAAGKGKRKPQYEGGLVLEPKKGFYDKLILLMDFNSLYPSIIQEYNICFTTVSVRGIQYEEGDLMTLMNHLPTSTQPGILPTEIRKLVESRREVKKLMAKSDISPDLRHQYDIRQLALKLTANSMYGCLGFPNSRFYAKPLAAMVTAKGREILVNTRDLVQRLNFDVIYGDTDSLMINTNCVDFDEVFKIGHKIKLEVNKLYKQIELDIDGVFKFMLLLKKKKYAAVTLSKVNGKLICKQEIKGLDIVRRDWSQLASTAGRYIVNQLLSEQNLEEKLANIHTKLSQIKNDLNDNKISLNLLAITKQLTKNPEEYPDKKSLPHVQVAIRMNQTLTKKFKQGDTIAYVVCEDGTTSAATQRAYHVDELKTNENLKIDVKYYLSQQIHPVVTRLCEPIEGIDAVQIAESLGLDTAVYARRIDVINDENDEIVLDEADKFKNCDKFEFRCLDEKCRAINIVDGPLKQFQENGPMLYGLERCVNANCQVPPYTYLPYLQNRLFLLVRSFIQKYYSGWMVCEDPICGNRTRVIRKLGKNLEPLCMSCNQSALVKEYNESQLYNQLCYLQYIFDVTPVLTKNKLSHESELFKAYCKLKTQVDTVLKWNAYNIIDLGKLCALMLMK